MSESTAVTEPRLKTKYREQVVPNLKQRFGIENPMAIPRLTKIVVNMGVKGAVESKARVETAARELTTITGQKPTIRIAKTSVAGFKLREGMPIGVKVTLRQARMYDFLDRLVTIALPRVRDFRGVNPKSFDGYGNYAMGVREHLIFPEIDYDKAENAWGMDVIICTTAKTDDEARALLKRFNMPFITSAN